MAIKQKKRRRRKEKSYRFKIVTKITEQKQTMKSKRVTENGQEFCLRFVLSNLFAMKKYFEF